MIVVSDTTPLSSLIHINRFNLLKELFRFVIIPSEVAAEINSMPVLASVIKANSSWINIAEVINKMKKEELMVVLDEGESAAIILAIERKADLILIDERKGKKIAGEYGFHTTGTLGILLQAKHRGLIKELKPDLLQLKYTYNFWMTDQLITQMLILAGEV
ncbi:DUF3368 domain-containing protein [Parafilimonas terrae]|jgi:predicted nucleic acid-binding protein|uniref:Nucleic acid-binding protein, contains PIN domain n=1 Tax=Parafilimonas terrae TaxID=1465490 RepID=A0A1I5ZJ60_9BACT|nr:DUF3368 domain-containing protein [Parafilimonas terrae]SFQ56519.1 hypothetical protein SAMN05444277_1382 [Parafilimonas terrae]